mgnify:CR=1 FL=1
MIIKIQQLRKKDFNMARKFAIAGMHLSKYTNNKIELYFYSKYFWFLEITKAKRALGAYINDRLVGVLLANIHNMPKVFRSAWYRAYVKIATFRRGLAYKNATVPYDDANKEMLEEYKKNNVVDGELLFFAVDPDMKGKGIGTMLLNELEKLEKGKRIYLYTDSGSTYQFYTHRGFEQVGKKEILIVNHKKKVALTCLLFSKTL